MQSRGVTWLANPIEPIAYHEDIQFAKLVQQQMVSSHAIIEEDTGSIQLNQAGGTQTGKASGATEVVNNTDGTSSSVRSMSPGAFYKAAPGKKLTGFSPNVPNETFFPHANLILSIIAVNLRMPVALLLLDPSQTNFSGWRGAMNQAQMGFKELQKNHANRLHRPVYQWRVRQLIENDPEVRQAYKLIGNDLFKHKWQTPTWDHIQPMEDTQARALQVSTLQTSPRRSAGQRGSDWNSLVQEIVEDNALLITSAKTKAQEINQQFPDDDRVTYRDLIRTTEPENISRNIMPEQQNTKEAPTNES